MHRSASLSLGFTASLARPLAHLPAWAGGHAGLDAGISYAGLRFGFSCLAHFGRRQNPPNTLRPETIAKILLNYSFFISARRKIYKRCFCFSHRWVKASAQRALRKPEGLKPSDCDCRGKK
jgi:hypothetical protein